MTYAHLERDQRDRIAVVTLNRPDKLNALDAILRDEILSVSREVDENDDIWAVVITGAGRGFCSGVDLTGARPESRQQSQNDRLDELGWVGRQAMAIYGLGKPTIAAVNGVAAGAGMSLALACDLRVGDATTRFRTVFVERNLSPDSGMSYFLPRIVGYSRAADLIMTSRDVGAEDAYRMGLLDRLVGDGALLDEAVELAALIASRPPMAVRSAKRVLQHNMEVGLEDALRYEMAGLSYARRAPNDAREAMESFVQRRPGQFTGT
jgi:2-(1,2-epoxy-1,2-dihydrophenyl)acetyl-CoA isomerase